MASYSGTRTNVSDLILHFLPFIAFFFLVQRPSMLIWEWMPNDSGATPNSRAATTVVSALFTCFRVFAVKKDNQAELKTFLDEHGLPLRTKHFHALGDPLDVLVRLSLVYSLSVTITVEPSLDLRTQDRMILLFRTGKIFLEWIKVCANE